MINLSVWYTGWIYEFMSQQTGVGWDAHLKIISLWSRIEAQEQMTPKSKGRMRETQKD